MNLDELMQSIGEEYPHPYTECHTMGFEHAVDKMTKAIVEACGQKAAEDVLDVLKRYRTEAVNGQ